MRPGGVIVPAAVPITARGEPDLAAYRSLVEILLGAGIHGIFVNGSMGGFATWTDAWQYRLAETAAATVAGRVPLLAGASDTGVARVLEKIQAQKHLPVDAFVVMPPYYYLLDQAELLRFYRTVADVSPKPVVLYNNPRLCKNGLAAATVAALAQHPNIAGMKESSSNVLHWQELLRAGIDRPRFSLICGAGRMTSLGLQLGFDGITEGLHNIVPHLAVELWAAASRGDWGAADGIQQKINRCFRIFDIAGGWRGLEVALQVMGIAPQAAPAPYDLPMTAEARAEILRVLETEGVRRAAVPVP